MEVPCGVVAPSSVPRRPGDRVKADRRNVRGLAQECPQAPAVKALGAFRGMGLICEGRLAEMEERVSRLLSGVSG